MAEPDWDDEVCKSRPWLAASSACGRGRVAGTYHGAVGQADHHLHGEAVLLQVQARQLLVGWVLLVVLRGQLGTLLPPGLHCPRGSRGALPAHLPLTCRSSSSFTRDQVLMKLSLRRARMGELSRTVSRRVRPEPVRGEARSGTPHVSLGFQSAGNLKDYRILCAPR